MAVYVGTSLAKKFLKYINAPPSSSKNIAPEGSQTISDYGFREFDQSDGEKEVEQPVPVAAVPLQSVPPLTTFKRKRHTKALASISEEPSMILSSPKRRKALIPDSDDETVSYPGTGRMTRSKQEAKEQERAEEEEKERKEAELDDDAKISSFARKRPSHRSSSAQPSNISLPHQSPSHEVPTTKLIIENPNSMVDLNQVGNPGDFIEPSNVSTLNTENPADSPLGVPEILSTKSLETPLPQGFDKSVHAPTKTSSPAVDISTPQVAVQPSLEESIPLEIHSSAATAHVKAFCNKVSLPVQTLVVLNPLDELKVLLNPSSPNLKSTFSQEEVQELIEIHQGFATWDFSSFIEHQLWDQFEVCCQA
ncbi:hypothetical protein RHGRI_001880 [Rhododendron griersonianum]|uniref:Structure-specific endonuclease subunit SLX4 n=1 Tax=Rhododendron griersonianum TaxID=479676 RepID=A0AAV6LN04_9ERIC|nr:hypothetical protein RHGRI_001880 [Rhododendron griersonianum]